MLGHTKTLLAIFCSLFLINCSGDKMKGDLAYFYLGTYTRQLSVDEKKDWGISRWSVNVKTGELIKVGGEWPIADSSHLCLGKDEKFLYSITEGSTFNGKRDGYLTIFKVTDDTGLVEIQKKSAAGIGPAYLHLDQTGDYLMLANYLAGNAVIYPIKEDGTLADPTGKVMHSGTSIHPTRQQQPHPHAFVPSPDNKFAYVPDLGIDKIKTYAFDEATGKLEARKDLDVTVAAGAGPRHLIFHPNNKFAYMTLELTGQVAAYYYDAGRLSPIGSYDLVPAGGKKSQSAEIRTTPDGNYLYVSNRGHNSITSFSVNQETGELKKFQVISTQGKTPRNFNIDPSGSVLVAGNQDSNTMIVYLISKEDGFLIPTKKLTKTLSPILFCFEKP